MIISPSPGPACRRKSRSNSSRKVRPATAYDVGWNPLGSVSVMPGFRAIVMSWLRLGWGQKNCLGSCSGHCSSRRGSLPGWRLGSYPFLNDGLILAVVELGKEDNLDLVTRCAKPPFISLRSSSNVSEYPASMTRVGQSPLLPRWVRWTTRRICFANISIGCSSCLGTHWSPSIFQPHLSSKDIGSSPN